MDWHKRIDLRIRWIYWLNVIDILITLLLLRTEMFIEANMFMVNLVTRPLLSTVVKLLVPLVVLLYVKARVKNSSSDELIMVHRGLFVLLALYVGITLLHAFNIVLYAVVSLMLLG